MSLENTFLFKEGKFSYHVLTKEYRDLALAVLARSFSSEGDYNNATFMDWIEYTEFWMDTCSTNGCSIYALDETAHRIAGVFIARDLLMVPEGFVEKYSDESNRITPWVQLLWHMDGQAYKVEPDLQTLGKTCDFSQLGVHPDYRGNKIANYLMKGLIPLVKKAGYKYAVIEAMNRWTSKAAIFNNFDSILEIDTTNWSWKGCTLCNKADSVLNKATFWIKELETF